MVTASESPKDCEQLLLVFSRDGLFKYKNSLYLKQTSNVKERGDRVESRALRWHEEDGDLDTEWKQAITGLVRGTKGDTEEQVVKGVRKREAMRVQCTRPDAL